MIFNASDSISVSPGCCMRLLRLALPPLRSIMSTTNSLGPVETSIRDKVRFVAVQRIASILSFRILPSAVDPWFSWHLFWNPSVWRLRTILGSIATMTRCARVKGTERLVSTGLNCVSLYWKASRDDNSENIASMILNNWWCFYVDTSRFLGICCLWRVQGQSAHICWWSCSLPQHLCHQNTMQRHRMIYSALSEELSNGLHALSLKTKSPEEVEVDHPAL